MIAMHIVALLSHAKDHWMKVSQFHLYNRSVNLSGSASLHMHYLQRKQEQQKQQRQATAPRPSRFSDGESSLIPPNPETLLNQQEHDLKVEQLCEWLDRYKGSILCLTGAGISTESGIPDYRGSSGSYHKGYRPMLHDQFMSSDFQRRRYWARSLLGWREFDSRQPNRGHYALTSLETLGILGVHDFACSEMEDDDNMLHLISRPNYKQLTTITQNVDSLHSKAGMSNVLELHGNVARTKCMHCGSAFKRHQFHSLLEEVNADWLWEQQQLALELQEEAQMRPDGDAQLLSEDYQNFVVPPCPHCKKGFLKPDVVLFGDTVPQARVRTCYNAVDACDAMLCVGTSLAVHSAFRFVNAAGKQGKPICILNVGPTRAESQSIPKLTKLDSPIGSTLEAVVRHLS